MVLLKHLEGDEIGFFTNLRERQVTSRLEGHSMVSAHDLVAGDGGRQGEDRGGWLTQMDRGLAEDYLPPRARGRAGWFGVGIGSEPAHWARGGAGRRGSSSTTLMFDGEDVPLPPFWGGPTPTLSVDRVEYWEGRPSRML